MNIATLPHRSRKFLIATAFAFLLALTATGAHTRGASAATSYTVAVTFDSVQFTKIDDSAALYGFNGYSVSTVAQAYGTMIANTASGGGWGPVQRLNLANWGSQPGFCPSGSTDWNAWNPALASCFRNAISGSTNGFANTYLCNSVTYTTCTGQYKQSNNTVLLTVTPGQQVRVGVLLYDYDLTSADDVICNAAQYLGSFNDAQLQSLNISSTMSMPFNGDGGCNVSFHVQRV